MNTFMNYVDGNAAAGELNRIFAMDITTAEGQCGNCGAKRLFAEAHLYLQCPGLVARCPLCGHVLLRLANIQERVFLDLRGMTNLTFDTAQESNVIS
jgi:DNA-directed RNA polymerase subunit RPC12/RpoP